MPTYSETVVDTASVQTNAYEQAVVIGGGIAGLITARVLADHFAQVTIIERDQRLSEPQPRQGVPQGRHTHTLMPRGQAILEQLFPNLLNNVKAKGAITIDAQKEIAFFHNGAWRTPNQRTANIAVSRPLLECEMHQRVMSHDNVAIMSGYQVTGLAVNEAGTHVSGVHLRPRPGVGGAPLLLTADLVVDTSGRASKAPQWLSQLGFTPPAEWRINSFVGYTSRVYEKPEGFDDGWKTLYIRPMAPDGTRGGIITPMENGRWCVTLIGVAGDMPATSDEGFNEFARSLPTDRLYNAIQQAKPLTKPFGFQRTENRVRRYDKLPRHLEGFIVCGDAAYALNPMYAQGMTAAAMAGQTLAESLTSQQATSDTLDGFAAHFQKALSGSVGRLWRMSTVKDWDWPITEVTDDEDHR